MLTEIAVTYPAAVLGTKVDLQTLDGKVTIDVPAGSETGTRLRLKGKGMPSLRRNTRGDRG